MQTRSPRRRIFVDGVHLTGGRAALQQIVILPVILTAIFTSMFLYDRARGGYRREILVQHQEEPEAEPDPATA